MLAVGTHLCDCFLIPMHTWRSLECPAANVSLHCSAPWSAHYEIASCLILDCCLEQRNSILPHRCHVAALSLLLTAAPVCWGSGALFLCLTTKISQRWMIIDHTHRSRVLIVDQTILTWHCMLTRLIDLSVEFPLLRCGCLRVTVLDRGSNSIFRIASSAWFELLGVTRRWVSPQQRV